MALIQSPLLFVLVSASYASNTSPAQRVDSNGRTSITIAAVEFSTMGANPAENMSGDNLFIGPRAGKKNIGHGNAFFGSEAGAENTTGESNTFHGWRAGFKNAGGTGNAFHGSGAGYQNTSGAYNIFMGFSAGTNNDSGGANVFVGANSGLSNTSGGENTFIGALAGHDNLTGQANTYVGYASGYYNHGYYNTMLGQAAGKSSSGDGNVFLGYHAGENDAGSNRLYIANSSTAEPIIFGDFSSGVLKFNANKIEFGPHGSVDTQMALGLTKEENQRVGLEIRNPSGGGEATSAIILRNGIQTGLLQLHGTGYADVEMAGTLVVGFVSGDDQSNGIQISTSAIGIQHDLQVGGDITAAGSLISLTTHYQFLAGESDVKTDYAGACWACGVVPVTGIYTCRSMVCPTGE